MAPSLRSPRPEFGHRQNLWIGLCQSALYFRNLIGRKPNSVLARPRPATTSSGTNSPRIGLCESLKNRERGWHHRWAVVCASGHSPLHQPRQRAAQIGFGHRCAQGSRQAASVLRMEEAGVRERLVRDRIEIELHEAALAQARMPRPGLRGWRSRRGRRRCRLCCSNGRGTPGTRRRTSSLPDALSLSRRSACADVKLRRSVLRERPRKFCAAFSRRHARADRNRAVRYRPI